MAAAALGISATVGVLVGTAPAAPAAGGSQPGLDALHPNLVRAAEFLTGPEGITADVPTQPGASYRLDLQAPAGADYEVTFGTGTAELSGAARTVVLDVAALETLTRLTMAAVGGTPRLPAQVAVHRLD
jgi:hypothetical protein